MVSLTLLGSGIIPAYAGSTFHCADLIVGGEDHPRIRGEHRGVAAQVQHLVGSSPHTRGALHELPRGGDAHRIIPAYAGSTSC